MSLRRKSCDACFKGRRKCDRNYPACGTCQRTKKSCHYAYAPISSATSSLPGDSISADTNINAATAAVTETTGDTAGGLLGPGDIFLFDYGGDQSDSFSGQRWPISNAASGTTRSSSTRLQRNPTTLPSSSTPSSVSWCASPRLPKLNIPNFLGGLGEVQRVDGSTDSWRWVIDELKRCPRDLATRGENLFMHKHLYRDAMPRAVRAALGSSAAFCMLNENNRQLLFRALDAEVLELLRPPPPLDEDESPGHGYMGANASSSIGSRMSLIEELARLQAFTLFQMMRMYGGGLEQRVIVEQQRDLLTTWALQLLRRSRAELGDDGHRASDVDGDCWHDWIVAESIRRTVMIVYMFYGMYSLATQGFCVEIPTLSKLPVSAAPASWHSEAAYLARSRSGEAQQTLTYEEFTQCWMVSLPKTVDPFDKFLVVPCKGFDGIAARAC
ncbi:hypothetical protein N8I77_012169 [Diaporthe amygdali]|uniref:Zn(2)-C6 fungal-type domain-containing protein n=1 Tax=Phomopsis amygdali TaxID=1214568 RepID=A0AAD9VXW6_PHOAM|nr:hypothetical protein N8I77_012169 [Diaporthe amygdali]